MDLVIVMNYILIIEYDEQKIHIEEVAYLPFGWYDRFVTFNM